MTDRAEREAELEAAQDAAGEEGDPRSLGEIGLDRFAPYLMNRAMGRWNAEIRAALRDHDLSTAQMRALAVLSVRRNPSIRELSVYTVTEPSTLSRALDQLEARDLIRRTARKGDGRAREIALTEKGAAAFERFWPHMRTGYEAMFAGVDEEEREAFLGTLRKIVSNVRRRPIPADWD